MAIAGCDSLEADSWGHIDLTGSVVAPACHAAVRPERQSMRATNCYGHKFFASNCSGNWWNCQWVVVAAPQHQRPIRSDRKALKRATWRDGPEFSGRSVRNLVSC